MQEQISEKTAKPLQFPKFIIQQDLKNILFREFRNIAAFYLLKKTESFIFIKSSQNQFHLTNPVIFAS